MTELLPNIYVPVLLFIAFTLFIGYTIRVKSKKNEEDRIRKHTERGNQSNQKEELTELGRHIIYVASEFENEEVFRSRAREVKEKLPFNKAVNLTDYFHSNPPIPDSLVPKLSKYGVLGVWMQVCQKTIFEILYNYKEKAVPTLYKIGFGEYDWTQYEAIDILCRIAQDGILEDEISLRISRNIKDFRWEALIPTLKSLSKIKPNNVIDNIYSNYFHEFTDLDSLYVVVDNWAKNYPTSVLKHKDFVISVANGQYEHKMHLSDQVYYTVKFNIILAKLKVNLDQVLIRLKEFETKTKNQKLKEEILDVIIEIEDVN